MYKQSFNEMLTPQKILMRFLFVVLMLLTYGLIFIYSASAVFACEQFGSAHYYLFRQSYALVIGIFLALCCALFPLERYKQLSSILLFFTFFLTVLTLVPGIGSGCHGARRWLLGSSLQPGEFLKVALFIHIAAFIEKKYFMLNNFFQAFLPLMLVTAGCAALFLLQPDFGSAVTIGITIFALCFVSGMQLNILAGTLVSSLPVLFLLVLYKPYRLQRVLTYLDPWSDPQGRGYQIIQSLIALGSGGIWGQGISYSKQKYFYLPMQHTDFIFSIIGEELGLVGTLSLLFLYLLFMYYGFQLIRHVRSLFAQNFIFLVIFFISLEAFLNCMVTTGLVPTKGLALPLVSYGSSVLLRSLCMIGLVTGLVIADYKKNK